MSQTLKNEVALVWGAVLTAVNAAQAVAVSIPPWAHAVIFVATATIAFLGIRARVTPVASLGRPPTVIAPAVKL